MATERWPPRRAALPFSVLIGARAKPSPRVYRLRPVAGPAGQLHAIKCHFNSPSSAGSAGWAGPSPRACPARLTGPGLRQAWQLRFSNRAFPRADRAVRQRGSRRHWPSRSSCLQRCGSSFQTRPATRQAQREARQSAQPHLLSQFAVRVP